jgi:hypothetical protein
MIKGMESFKERCRALKYETSAAPATSTFKSSAVEDMIEGENAKKERIAKYPDAPPCPTEEYRAATMKTSAAMINSDATSMRKDPFRSMGKGLTLFSLSEGIILEGRNHCRLRKR